MLISEKLCLTNDGHFHQHDFEDGLESLSPLLAKVSPKRCAANFTQRPRGLHPYKVTIVQQLNERDYQQRLTFCQTVLTCLKKMRI